MNEIEAGIEKAISLLKQANNVVALTGAGISTPSGIPDFRSPGSGIWDQVDPMEVASIFGFRRRPEAFYEWMRPLAGLLVQAQPNPAHIALAQLEEYGPLRGIITQNIDMLHTRAGSKVIHEVHGHMRRVTCLQCGKDYDGQPIWNGFLATNEIPTCLTCGGILKPDVVLFGEMLPFFVMSAAQKAAESCDLMLVAGSSLEVTPVADLPRLTRRTGARLIIVNYSETYADQFAEVVIQADVAKVLPRLAAPFLPGAG